MIIDVDWNEMENQRAEEIKKKDKYLEFKTLIGVCEDEDEIDVPVVSTELHHCGSEEIAKLYAVLQKQIEDLEEEYPAECMYARIFLKLNSRKKIEYDLSENKEDKDENNSL